jgi:hypothetical protein
MENKHLGLSRWLGCVRPALRALVWEEMGKGSTIVATPSTDRRDGRERLFQLWGLLPSCGERRARH